jgi:hypothetical protein
MASISVGIFSRRCFRRARVSMGENSLFMQTMLDPTQLESVENFVSKTDCGSPYTNRTRLISHHPISFSSDMSSTVEREWCFHRRKIYLQEFVRYWPLLEETLQGIFDHWMERLEWISQNKGNYYP